MSEIPTHRALRRSLLLAGAAATALFGNPALAQDAPADEADEAQGNVIIVSATKRDTTIQDVPFSINAQTEKDIQRSGVVTIEDLSRNVAGLTIQNLGPGQSQVSVRGISAGQVVRDQPGALYGVLSPFARHGVSMNRIESRPAHTGRWQYAFFIDISGHAEDPPVAAALAELGEYATDVRVLGAYPVALL